MSRSLSWNISAALIAVAWVASIAMVSIGMALDIPALGSWAWVIMNILGPATAILVIWIRTQHPMDTFALGIIEGERREIERAARHPRSGELRVLRGDERGARD